MIDLKNGEPVVGTTSSPPQRRHKFDCLVTVALLLMIALGAVVRLINLGYPSLWVDEYDHLYAAKNLLETGRPTLPSGVPYTRAFPFTLLVAVSFRFLGISEFSARLPSVVFGLLLIPLGFLLGRFFYNKWAGLVTAFLITFLPQTVGWSRACRMYTLFAVLYVLVVLCFYKGFEPNSDDTQPGADPPEQGCPKRPRTVRPGWLLLCGLLLALTCYVQMLGALFGIVVVSYCLAMTAVIARRKGLRAAAATKYAAALGAIVLGALLVLATTSALQRMWAVANECPPYALWKARMYSYYLPYLFGTRLDKLAILGAFALAFRGKSGLYLLCALIPPLLFHSFALRWKAERYIFYLAPIFRVLVAVGVLVVGYWVVQTAMTVAQRLGASSRVRSASGWVTGISLVALVLASYSSLWQGAMVSREYHGVTVPHNDWRGAGRYVRARMHPSDAVASAVPLATLYYAGKNPEYVIRRFETFNSLAHARHHDLYGGGLILEDVPMMTEMMRKHQRGWLMVDVTRWNRFMLSEAQMAFIKRHMKRHPKASDGTVMVYSWGVR